MLGSSYCGTECVRLISILTGFASCVLCRSGTVLVSFFFFQAEDGIRDLIVTGVQTCALPISAAVSKRQPAVHSAAQHLRRAALRSKSGLSQADAGAAEPSSLPLIQLQGRLEEIGRASCRERV